jgi:PadR family transcriptional regulator PadR
MTKIDHKWEAQLRKGILDYILLSYLSRREYYGYELVTEIETGLGMSLSEGTIYPLLTRLKREGWVTTEWVEMETGLPRKYYRLTQSGKAARHRMGQAWDQLDTIIKKLRKTM